MAQVTATAPQEKAHSSANKGNKLCLCSLDGGGVRGLSSLQILKQLMELIDPKNPPKPCDYFDMIGGTSTGGLIAIMLGRLRLSVDECIEEYKKLSDRVFTKLHHRVTVKGKVQGRFDHEALVAGVQELLERKGLPKDELLRDDIEEGCKTFVCTTSKETSDTVVLPSYYTQRWGTDMLNKTKIWEAARATSAATTFFDPITIGSETFVDGATGANNPIQELMIEADNLWSEKRPSWRIEDNLQCVVSIGTGVPSLKPFGDKLWDVPQTLLAIATDTERTAEKWQRGHDILFREKRAFRFNVISGLEDIGLEESKRQGDILAATKRYIALQNVLDQMVDCAENLQARKCLSYILGTADVQRMLLSRSKNLRDGLWRKETLDSIMHASRFQIWCQTPGEMIWCVTKTQDQIQDQILAAYLEQELSGQFSWNSLYYAFPFDARKILRNEQLKEESRQSNGPELERQPKREGAAAIALFRSLIVQTVIRIVGDKSAMMRLAKLSSQELSLLRNSTAEDAMLNDQINILGELFHLDGRRNVIFLECIDVLDADEIKGLLVPIQLLLARQSLQISVLISGYPDSNISPQLSSIPTIDEMTEYYECLETLTFEELNTRRNQITDAEPGTNHWIWSHPAYLRFKRERTGILWIEGKPGSGKSVLAKTIQRDLRAKPSDPSSGYYFRVGDWFYHGRRGGQFISHQSFLKSMLYQLLKCDPVLFSYFRGIYRQRHDAASREMPWNYDILLKIFEKISRDGVEMMCVLDALDEAQNIEIVELVESLTVKCPLSRTKFIILSRGNVEIERVLLKYHRILLEENNTDDISRFIESGKMSLSKAIHALDFESEIEVEPSRSGIPRNSRPSRAPRRNVGKKINVQEKQELEFIGKYIQARANGTFLWVKLVFDQLHIEVEKGIGTFGELKKRLKEYPEKLTDFYQRITTYMHCGAPIRNIKFARKALMWVSGASELAEFSLEELWDALAVSLEEDEQEQDKVQDAEASCTDRVAERRIPIRSFHEFRRKIHGICGPLVEVLKPSTMNEHSEFTTHGGQSTVQLMHQTVKDFLSLPEAAGELHFYPDEAIQMVNHLCLRYIKLIGATVPRLRVNLRYDYGTITAAEMVEWLDDKKLLRFALHTQPRWEHHEISVYQQIFCTVLAPPEPNTLDWELVDALKDSRYVSTAKLSAQAISAGRLFHLACSEGLVVAASNLVTITSFLPNWWKANCRVIKHAVMLAASEVNTSSLKLGLKPATLHQTVHEIGGLSPLERSDLSMGERAARAKSPTEALSENNHTFFSANPKYRTLFHKFDSEVPKISAPPPSTYSTTLSRALPKSKRTSGPARAHPDSEDESDAESAVAIPFIPTASKGATALSTTLSEAQQRLSMLTGPKSESEDDWDRQKLLPSFAAANTPELRKKPIIPPENARISPASKPNGESKATSKAEIPAHFGLLDIGNGKNIFITDKRASTTRISSASERMSHSDLPPAAPVVVETDDSSDDSEDERRPTTFATRRKSLEQPPPIEGSIQETWISSGWTVTLVKHSTTSKQQFSISTKFENWCSLVDKICGGKAQMLRSKRRKLYRKDELPYTEDIEEAIGVVLQKFREVDYDVPQLES